MGKCTNCGKDTGWGGGFVCDKHLLSIGDRVKVMSGSSYGKEAVIIDGHEGFLSDVIKVRFSDGTEKYMPELTRFRVLI